MGEMGGISKCAYLEEKCPVPAETNDAYNGLQFVFARFVDLRTLKLTTARFDS